MVASIHNITFVTTGDPYELAQFWSKVVDRPLHVEDEPGDPEASLIAEGQPTMLFVRVPEGKADEPRTGRRRMYPLPAAPAVALRE